MNFQTVLSKCELIELGPSHDHHSCCSLLRLVRWLMVFVCIQATNRPCLRPMSVFCQITG